MCMTGWRAELDCLCHENDAYHYEMEKELASENKQEYEVYFSHRTRIVKFSRYAANTAEAVQDAKDGFQFAYGYWPEEPLRVKVVNS